MRKLDKNSKLILLYITSSIVLEMLFFLLLGFGVFPTYFWFDLSAILVIAAFIFLAYNFTFKSVVFWLFYLLQILLCITNIVVKKAASELFSIEMLFLSSEGIRAFEISFIDYVRLTPIFVMFLIVLFAYMRIAKSKDDALLYKPKRLPYIFATFFLMCFLGTSGYVAQINLIRDTNSTDPLYVFQSDKYLFNTLSSKTDAYQKFGTFGYYIQNLNNLLYKEDLQQEEKEAIAQYFASAKLTKSPMFGVSNNNNVMTILLETMEYYAIDPYFTPNLYNIFYESDDTIKLTNFHANNRTNISEGLVLFGNYDKRNSINIASDNVLEVFNSDVEFTLPSILKEYNYETTYYHDYVSWYYNRNITHTAAGFDEVIGLDKMDKLSAWVDYEMDSKNEFYKWKNWVLDSDVMNVYFDDMTNSQNNIFSGDKFYTHFSLITMHGNHDEKPQLQEYYDILTQDIDTIGGHFDKMLQFLHDHGYNIHFDNDKMKEHFLWYKSAAMDVDKMVGILIENLSKTITNEYDAKGNRLSLLDTTTILFFADHNCYYNGLANYMRGLQHSYDVYDTSLYHIPCVIYDKKLADTYYEKYNTLEINKFTSTFNLLPTLLDVLGKEYNPLIYEGDCMFNEGTNMFQSNISGTPYFNDRIMLSYSTTIWKKDDVTIEEENTYIEEALKTHDRRLYISKLYDYPEILKMYSDLIK